MAGASRPMQVRVPGRDGGKTLAGLDRGSELTPPSGHPAAEQPGRPLQPGPWAATLPFSCRPSRTGGCSSTARNRPTRGSPCSWPVAPSPAPVARSPATPWLWCGPECRPKVSAGWEHGPGRSLCWAPTLLPDSRVGEPELSPTRALWPWWTRVWYGQWHPFPLGAEGAQLHGPGQSMLGVSLG